MPIRRRLSGKQPVDKTADGGHDPVDGPADGGRPSKRWRSGALGAADDEEAPPAADDEEAPLDELVKVVRTDGRVAIVPACLVAPAERAKRFGLNLSEYEALCHFSVPLILWNTLAMLFDVMGVIPRDLHCLDMFAGEESVRKAWTNRGYAAIGYEILKGGETMDLNSGAGWVTAVIFIMRLVLNGFSSWGTVCSSWIWVCLSTSKRTKENPLGDTDKAFVVNGNTMVARMSALLLLLEARGCVWLLEQPATSIMPRHPYLAWVIRNTSRIFTVTTSMGAFGAPTRKPTILRGNRWWIERLRRTAPRLPQSTTTTRNTNPVTGRLEVTGTKDLKATQVYPPGYGEALVNEWEQWTATGHIIIVDQPTGESTNNNGWDLVNVTNIETFMSGAGFAFDSVMELYRSQNVTRS